MAVGWQAVAAPALAFLLLSTGCFGARSRQASDEPGPGDPLAAVYGLELVARADEAPMNTSEWFYLPASASPEGALALFDIPVPDWAVFESGSGNRRYVHVRVLPLPFPGSNDTVQDWGLVRFDPSRIFHGLFHTETARIHRDAPDVALETIPAEIAPATVRFQVPDEGHAMRFTVVARASSSSAFGVLAQIAPANRYTNEVPVPSLDEVTGPVTRLESAASGTGFGYHWVHDLGPEQVFRAGTVDVEYVNPGGVDNAIRATSRASTPQGFSWFFGICIPIGLADVVEWTATGHVRGVPVNEAGRFTHPTSFLGVDTLPWFQRSGSGSGQSELAFACKAKSANGSPFYEYSHLEVGLPLDTLSG